MTKDQFIWHFWPKTYFFEILDLNSTFSTISTFLAKKPTFSTFLTKTRLFWQFRSTIDFFVIFDQKSTFLTFLTKTTLFRPFWSKIYFFDFIHQNRTFSKFWQIIDISTFLTKIVFWEKRLVRLHSVRSSKRVHIPC